MILKKIITEETARPRRSDNRGECPGSRGADGGSNM
jgi:hypothetical protein